MSQSLSPSKKPLPWTHEETLNLIRAYQDKWYSLHRGQLKASQWDQVSLSVAAFCRLNEPSKSATQCRHKIEKLRKRYRSEKQKPYPNSSSWVYFDLMDRLERGPLPISAKPPPLPSDYCSGSDEDESRLWGCHPDVTVLPVRINNEFKGVPSSRGVWEDSDVITAIPLQRMIPSEVGGASRSSGVWGNCPDAAVLPLRRLELGGGYRKMSDFEGGNTARKRKFYEETERGGEGLCDGGEEEDEEEDEDEDDVQLVGELAAQMREFAESYVKMERKKMEVVRENERLRMEMENKRLEMILASHKKSLEMITKAYNSSKDFVKHD